MAHPVPGQAWRVVLDTATLISGIRSRRGAAREVLRQVLTQQLRIVIDLKLSLEYHDVALRKHHLQAGSMSVEDMLRLLGILERYAEPVEAVRLLRPFSPDPDDEMIVELAVAASADAIVTTNLRHFERVTHTFGILVLTPGEMLARLERTSL